VPVGVQLYYQFQFHAVRLYPLPNLTPYCTAVRQCLSVYSYLFKFSFTPSVIIYSPIKHLTVQLSVSASLCTVILSISVSRRQSVFTAQSNTLPYNCPSVPVGVQLSSQFQFHAVSLYSQPNPTPYRTAVRQCLSVYGYLIYISFPPSVCIHSPIQHHTLQLSVSAWRCTVILLISVSRRQSVLTAQSIILPYSCPTVPVGVSYLINFSFTPSVCIHSPIQHLNVQLSVISCRCTVILSNSVSRHQSLFTAQSITLPYICPSVHVGVELSYQFQFHAVSVFTAQSNTIPYTCPSVHVGVQLSYQFQFHAVSLYSQPNLTPYRTAVRQCLSVYSYHINFSYTSSVCIHSPI